MLTATWNMTLEWAWGERDNPFFALATGSAGVPDYDNANVIRRLRDAANQVSQDFDLLSYDFFDLLRESGHFPGILPEPANDNWKAAA
jgi:hypothetical protein